MEPIRICMSDDKNLDISYFGGFFTLHKSFDRIKVELTLHQMGILLELIEESEESEDSVDSKSFFRITGGVSGSFTGDRRVLDIEGLQLSYEEFLRIYHLCHQTGVLT